MQVVLFHVGTRQFGLDMPLIKSIHRASALFSEQSEEIDTNSLMIDGEKVQLYDLPSILGQGTSFRDPGSKKVMLVDAQKHLLALMVDSIDEAVSVESDKIEPMSPIFNGTALTCFPQVLRQEENPVLLLNPEGVKGVRWEIQDLEDMSPEPEDMKDIQETEEVIDLGGILQSNSNSVRIPHATSPAEEEVTEGMEGHPLLSTDIVLDSESKSEPISGDERAATQGELPGMTARQPDERAPQPETIKTPRVKEKRELAVRTTNETAPEEEAPAGMENHLSLSADAKHDSDDESGPSLAEEKPSSLEALSRMKIHPTKERAAEPEVKKVLKAEKEPTGPGQKNSNGKPNVEFVSNSGINRELLKKIAIYVMKKCRKKWRQSSPPDLNGEIDPLVIDLTSMVPVAPKLLKRIVARIVEKCNERWSVEESTESAKKQKKDVKHGVKKLSAKAHGMMTGV